MRSYVLLVLACTVLHARAASIPVPVEAEKKLPIENNALDNVSLDDNASELELVDPNKLEKHAESSLSNSIPIENVPVKVIEEQPVIKTIALKEDSNDYVPDNDDSTNIKRVEIDLKNPGPPQRQEHDSQNPGFYQDKEKAVATIKQSIAESEIIFKRGVQDVKQKFKNYFANNEDLKTVQANIQNLKESVNADLTKLSNTINNCLKPQNSNSEEVIEKIPGIVEVENHLKTLETNFNTGVDMLTEGVEILSILKEEDESEMKISGKADNENIAETSGQGESSTVISSSSSTTAPPSTVNPVMSFMDSFFNSVSSAFTNLGNSVQNLVTPNQNQNQNAANSTSNFNIFQNLPNIFQNQQNQNQNQNQAQGSPPAGAQADEATPTRPNFLQQITTNIQNLVNPGNNQQQTQNPFVQASNQLFQSISSIFPWSGQGNQQNNQGNVAAVSQPAANKPVADAPAQGSNAVPAPPAPPADPPKPTKAESAPVQGPIQQLVQNSPIVQGITHTVQRIQGLSNPSKPRDTPTNESSDLKGHKPGSANGGDINISGIDKINEPVKEEPQTIKEVKKDEQEPEVEITKTE